jgi:hypothetical protein
MHYFHDYQHFLVGVPNDGWYLGDQNQPLRSVYEGFQTYCAQPYSIPAAPWQMITLHSANACIHWDDEEGDPWDQRPAGEMDLRAAWAPLVTERGKPINSPDDYSGQTAPGVIHTPAPPWPGLEEMIRRVQAELASGRNPELLRLLDSLLGGSSTSPLELPFPGYIEHWEQHGAEFDTPYSDPYEYVQGARDLVRRAAGGGDGYEECERSDGAIIYWDINKEEMVIVKDGAIVTYMHPDDGHSYFLRECAK